MKHTMELSKEVWEMIYLCYFDEFYPGVGYSSIKPLLQDKPYPGQKEAIAYMKSKKSFIVSANIPTDVVSGKPCNSSIAYFDDGVYGWSSELIYYVEKYNLALPKSSSNT